jgi:pectinesterase
LSPDHPNLAPASTGANFFPITRRQALAAAVALPIAGCAGQEAGFEAVVGVTHASLAAAIADATGIRPFRVRVPRGRWREKIVVTQPHVHLIGEDRHASVIEFGAAAGHSGPQRPYGTRGCATLTVRAPGFVARNLTIANTFDYLGNLAKAEDDPTRLKDPQGVALMLDEGSDRALIEDVELFGHQDTLFIDRGVSLFRQCRVQGSVDFVFGAGRSVLLGCEVVSRFRPGKPRQGYVAAPSTPASQPFGLVFHDCRLTKERAVPASSVVLGRPWRPARQFEDGRYGDPAAVGHAAFIGCWMDDHISADGWDEMGYTAKSGERVFLPPTEARLGEFESRGPGARADARRRRLIQDEAARCSVQNVLDGWQA